MAGLRDWVNVKIALQSFIFFIFLESNLNLHILPVGLEICLAFVCLFVFPPIKIHSIFERIFCQFFVEIGLYVQKS